MSQLQDRIASMVHAFHDRRRREGVRALAWDVGALEARLAALEAEAKQAREDEAWAHSGHVGCIARGDDGWVASRWNVEMQSMDQVNAPTIHAALRAIRAKVEGGAR